MTGVMGTRAGVMITMLRTFMDTPGMGPCRGALTVRVQAPRIKQVAMTRAAIMNGIAETPISPATTAQYLTKRLIRLLRYVSRLTARDTFTIAQMLGNLLINSAMEAAKTLLLL
jgi:hypothetical protein